MTRPGPRSSYITKFSSYVALSLLYSAPKMQVEGCALILSNWKDEIMMAACDWLVQRRVSKSNRTKMSVQHNINKRLSLVTVMVSISHGRWT